MTAVSDNPPKATHREFDKAKLTLDKENDAMTIKIIYW